jgi:hypothetical protein
VPDDEGNLGDQEPLVGNDDDEKNPFVLKEKQAGDDDDDDDDDEENPFVLKENQALLSSKDGYGSVFFLHRFITVLALGLLLVTQVTPFLFLLFTTRVVLGDPVQFALRIYVALFCLIGVLVETEVQAPPCFKRIKKEGGLLHNWIWRGFLYSFLGLVGCKEGIAVQTELLHPSHNSEPSKMIDIQINWVAVIMETCSWVWWWALASCISVWEWFAVKRCAINKPRPIENASNSTNKKNSKHSMT